VQGVFPPAFVFGRGSGRAHGPVRPSADPQGGHGPDDLFREECQRVGDPTTPIARSRSGGLKVDCGRAVPTDRANGSFSVRGRMLRYRVTAPRDSLLASRAYDRSGSYCDDPRTHGRRRSAAVHAFRGKPATLSLPRYVARVLGGERPVSGSDRGAQAPRSYSRRDPGQRSNVRAERRRHP
jgi:hypothetical protein